METNKIDSAPSTAVAREQERTAGLRAERQTMKSATRSPASTASVSVSLEISVTLRVEMRALQAQQGRAGEALGEIDTARSGLGRMQTQLTQLRAYAVTVLRAEDSATQDAYTQTFQLAQRAFVDLQREVQMPGDGFAAVVDEALTRATVDADTSDPLPGAGSSAGDLLAGFPRLEAIFDAVRAPGLGDFSNPSAFGQTFATLDSSIEGVESMRHAFDAIGERLEERITTLAAEIANVEAATSVPDTLDDALALAFETRDQVEQDARRATVAQGVPSPVRLLELLEE